jgi:superfamily II DNA or RNA helicase
MIELRDWQKAAFVKAIDWFEADGPGKHFLINAAPGSGKTICASVIARELLEQKKVSRVVVIAPRREVVKQWADEFRAVTGRPMTQVTGADDEVANYGLDVCATWSAINGLLEGFQVLCEQNDVLVICDEHHHAAVKAAWGDGADSAFSAAKHVLILSGTPVRSDGFDIAWLEYDDFGNIDLSEDATYTLTYGEAVDCGYCRPITFHRHEGRFSVALNDGSSVDVSGTADIAIPENYERIPGLKRALDFYKLACTPRFQSDGKTPDLDSYQATMIERAIVKLNEARLEMPNAGGLVIAPSIDVAEYMADILEKLDGEKPTIVHSNNQNAENRIASFRNSDKRWIVSVAMISEGVDIKRLRVLVYLPSAQTELSFRQAMGRVVRSMGRDDMSRAYVVMPTHSIFEEYARRVEREMSPSARKNPETSKTKKCPICNMLNSLDANECSQCAHEFEMPKGRHKACASCGTLNPLGVEACTNCGESFLHDFNITLDEALRVGVIARGMDVSEEDVRQSEEIASEVKRRAIESGDDILINMLGRLPEETFIRLKQVMDG